MFPDDRRRQDRDDARSSSAWVRRLLARIDLPTQEERVDALLALLALHARTARRPWGTFDASLADLRATHPALAESIDHLTRELPQRDEAADSLQSILGSGSKETLSAISSELVARSQAMWVDLPVLRLLGLLTAPRGEGPLLDLVCADGLAPVTVAEQAALSGGRAPEVWGVAASTDDAARAIVMSSLAGVPLRVAAATRDGTPSKQTSIPGVDVPEENRASQLDPREDSLPAGATFAGAFGIVDEASLRDVGRGADPSAMRARREQRAEAVWDHAYAALALVRPGARIVLAVPSAVPLSHAGRAAEKRRHLLETGALRAVVEVPRQARFGRGGAFYVVLERPLALLAADIDPTSSLREWEKLRAVDSARVEVTFVRVDDHDDETEVEWSPDDVARAVETGAAAGAVLVARVPFAALTTGCRLSPSLYCQRVVDAEKLGTLLRQLRAAEAEERAAQTASNDAFAALRAALSEAAKKPSA